MYLWHAIDQEARSSTPGGGTEMIEWRGPDFDPETIDEAVIQNQLTWLARPSRRKPKAAASP
jgi:hypothetical protein